MTMLSTAYMESFVRLFSVDLRRMWKHKCPGSLSTLLNASCPGDRSVLSACSYLSTLYFLHLTQRSCVLDVYLRRIHG